MKKNLKDIVIAILVFLNIILFGVIMVMFVKMYDLLEGVSLDMKIIQEQTNDEIFELTNDKKDDKEDSEEIKDDEELENVEDETKEVVSANEINEENTYKPKWNFTEAGEYPKLADKMAEGTSYDETMRINAMDKKIIAENNIDFSNMKIACMGDSITEGKGESVPYPTYLKELLGAKEVINYGIGGSTISRAGNSYPMQERVNQMEEVDLVVVLGGSNDMFDLVDYQFGYMHQEPRGETSFCCDLDLMMNSIETRPYTNQIYFAPPDNTLLDELMSGNDRLLDQSVYSEAFQIIAADEEQPLYDMYNSYFLSSHDERVKSEYMIDSVHYNSEGNKIIAERIAAEIIAKYTK